MNKLELNKKIKKDSLLNTAFELFTTKGIHKTSIAEIVQHAGVAKGTFYLYFKDKYDIRNKLISHKSSQLFFKAVSALNNTTSLVFEDKIIFIVDHIIDALTEDKTLLSFISKNLSWGIFKSALTCPIDPNDINFYDIYLQMLEEEHYNFIDPEIMLFLIVELVGSTCYSAILYNEPTNIELLKPHLFQNIRHIISDHKKGEQD